MERQGLIDVLVVDGHYIVAKGLAMVVNGEPTIRAVATAGSIKEAVEACIATPPDVVLMDVDLPDGDTIAAIRRIRAVSPSSKIVMVTGARDDKALAVAVDTGCRVRAQGRPSRGIAQRRGLGRRRPRVLPDCGARPSAA